MVFGKTTTTGDRPSYHRSSVCATVKKVSARPEVKAEEMVWRIFRESQWRTGRQYTTFYLALSRVTAFFPH